MQDIHLLRHNLLSFFENNIYNSPNNWAVEGNLRNIRIEEIPFSLSDFKKQEERPLLKVSKTSDEIYANRNLRKSRSFFHIFKVPFIVCFFAARGKWPFIPPFMQNGVDAASRTFFNQNDTYIRQYCNKWIQIKECFRPNYYTTTTEEPSRLEVFTARAQRQCHCPYQQAQFNNPGASPISVVYFDQEQVGNVSVETIRDTIEFLQNFLPPEKGQSVWKKTTKKRIKTSPTRKNNANKKRKPRIQSRLDEIEISPK